MTTFVHKGSPQLLSYLVFVSVDSWLNWSGLGEIRGPRRERRGVARRAGRAWAIAASDMLEFYSCIMEMVVRRWVDSSGSYKHTDLRSTAALKDCVSLAESVAGAGVRNRVLLWLGIKDFRAAAHRRWP